MSALTGPQHQRTVSQLPVKNICIRLKTPCHCTASCPLYSRYSATRPDYLQGACWKDLKTMITTLCPGALLQACRFLKYLNERSAPASGPFAVGPQLCRLTLLRFPHGPIRQPGHLSQCAAVGTSTITSPAQLPPLSPLPWQDQHSMHTYSPFGL